MSVRSLDELRPEARAEVEGFLGRLRAGFCQVSPDLAEDVLAESLAHFLEALWPDSDVADVADVVRELGEPDEYAAALCAVLREEGSIGVESGEGVSTGTDDAGPGAGRIFGVPYDLRPPTAERVRRRWWDPADPRVFVPKAFGLGWDLNLGALAVRLRLIRPDDEDVPFTSAPRRALLAALVVPGALTALIVGLWVTFRGQLPPELPMHWDVACQPDRFWETPDAVLFHVAISGVPTLWAVWAFAAKRSGGAQALLSALATLFASIAAGAFTSAVLWGLGTRIGWLVPASVAGGVGLMFAMLVLLARASRRAEWTREMGSRRSGAHRPGQDESQ